MQRKTTAIIASCVILISLGLIWERSRNPYTVNNRSQLTGMGAVLADEVIKVVNGQGQIVLVIDAAQAQTREPAGALVVGFRDQLSRHGAVNLATTEIVQLDLIEDGKVFCCSSAKLKELLDKYGSATAMVFFMDLPEWNRVREFQLQPAGLKLIVVGGDIVGQKLRYAGYFANGSLSALIIPRREFNTSTSVDPKTPREKFDRDSLVVTPQNYAAILDDD